MAVSWWIVCFFLHCDILSAFSDLARLLTNTLNNMYWFHSEADKLLLQVIIAQTWRTNCY